MEEKWLKQLRKYVLFRELNDVELQMIAQAAKEDTYQEEEIIFNYGEAGGTLYLINEGMVEITIPIMRFDSREERVSVLKEGDCFGELSLFDGKDHSARATAIKSSKVVTIHKDDFNRIIKEDPQIGIELQSKILSKIINIVREMNTRYSYKPFLE